MGHGTRFERVRAGWQRAVAALFALAVIAAPVLAFAQGAAGGGGTGSSGSGGGAPGGAPPPGAPGGTGGGGGGGGFAWIVVILAIALAIWLFTRRRGGPAHHER